jgi:cellobiose dehydrogenase (acceptor)
MKVATFFKAASLLSSLFTPAVAQDTFTHAKTGITFVRQKISEAQTTGGFEWGFALPEKAGVADDEYIGYMVGSALFGKDSWTH